MKKLVILNLLGVLFTTVACSGTSMNDMENLIKKDINKGNVYLSRPDDYEADYWITEPKNSEIPSLLYIPGFGGEIHVDSKYVNRKDIEKGRVENPPEECIVYTFGGYVDVLDGYAAINISITDPKITLYGLTMKSSEEDIDKTMLANKFKKFFTESNDVIYYQKNCIFDFAPEAINIRATTTNVNHVFF